MGIGWSGLSDGKRNVVRDVLYEIEVKGIYWLWIIKNWIIIVWAHNVYLQTYPINQRYILVLTRLQDPDPVITA